MQLVDTHCHIQEAQYKTERHDGVQHKWREGGSPDADDMIAEARQAGVARLICVGCTVDDSALAVAFVQQRVGTWASIGIHPHESKRYVPDAAERERFARLASQPKVIAVGECGLDYFYNHSPKSDQERMLRFQIELALKHDLPIIFHVRDAFADFWPIFDSYKGTRGVIHSFTATRKELDQILARNLYVGLNGITTFAKDPEQQAAAAAVPLEKLLLETDAPFLTPHPDRGKICKPKHVRVTAQFLSDVRGESLERLAQATTQNAQALFNF